MITLPSKHGVKTDLKRFQVTIPGRLWLVLDSLSDLNGYDTTKSLVEQLICDYCRSAIKQLRDDVNSDFRQCWRYEFDES